MKPHADWIIPDWPVATRVKALITTRAGGLSHGPYTSFNLGTHVGDDPDAVSHNRERLRAVLPGDPVWLHQVHGTQVIDAATASGIPTADAAYCRVRHVVCGVLTADCMPVLLAARDGSVVAVAHAGWRGMAAGVIEATLSQMKIAAEDTLAYLGPAIGPAAFEVGPDVLTAFAETDSESRVAFEPKGEGKYHADLYALARRRLMRAGLREIHGGSFCTYEQSDRFYSYRREKTTGRMASLIWID
ncbi:MAG TPA: peptidoglycan editing factor PgeF [Burkholderiales bacterium]|nr:peptidoglycan editing factor PgeF [Burkholderiales bacterium]